MRWSLLASTLVMGGCTTGLVPFGNGGSSPPAAAPAAPAPMVAPVQRKVGVLLPLSGPNGGLGQSMLQAARLAVAAPGSPVLDARDTAAPAGAAGAARTAIAAGDGLLLGPLTSGDTAAVAPIARAAGVPVLAFTSDVNQAQPGIWAMGVTPEQQVRRLVLAARAEGRTRMAALLPANAFGSALAEGLTRACAEAGLPPPTILTHGNNGDSIASAMNQLSGIDGRKAAIAAAAVPPPAPAAAPAPAADAPSAIDPVPAAPASAPAVVPAVPAPPPAPLPPPPFDALLLGDTGLQLQQVITALRTDGIVAGQVRVMGPGLWSAFAGKLHALSGAWFAAPDPSARRGFVAEYRAAQHQTPKPLDDIPYDAAALARSLAPTGYTSDALLRPDGFAGVDGVFALEPDGHVRRGLAIFQIQPGGGATIVQPAPGSLSTGS